MWWMHPGVASAVADGDGTAEEDPRVAPADSGAAQDCDQRIAAIVGRGHADGSLDTAIGPAWVEQLLWATLYATAHAPTLTALTGFEARAHAPRSLLEPVAADPSAV